MASPAPRVGGVGRFCRPGSIFLSSAARQVDTPTPKYPRSRAKAKQSELLQSEGQDEIPKLRVHG